MILKSRGQSLLEYAGIVILIILGMVIGRIVIDRGAKAGIKNLTSSVEESDLEIIKQAPVDDGIHLPDCSCSPWRNGGCGAGSCGDTYRYQFRACAPQGCENTVNPPITTERCISDNNCCTAWQLVTGIADIDCGINAASAPNNYNPPDGCPDDSGLSMRQCGTLPTELSCQDDILCHFRCGGVSQIPPQYSQTCFPLAPPTSGDNARLRNNSTDYTLISATFPGCLNCPGPNCNVGNCPECFAPTKCKAFCKENFVYNQNTQQCECQTGYVYNPDTGNCELACTTGGANAPYDTTSFYSDTPHVVQKFCQSNEVMMGIKTINNGAGGHNYWKLTCKQLSSGCPLQGSPVQTPMFNEFRDANGVWAGQACPYGYAMVGVSTINLGEGGDNNWWLWCQQFQNSSCVLPDYWQAGQYMGSSMQTGPFYEDTESHWVGNQTPDCRYATALFTKRVKDDQGGHNHWVLGSGSCGGPGSGIPVNYATSMGMAQFNSRSGKIARAQGAFSCISSDPTTGGGGAWMTAAEIDEADYGGSCQLGHHHCPQGGGHCCTLWVPGFAYAISNSARACFDPPESFGTSSNNYPILRGVGIHGVGNDCHPGIWYGQCREPNVCNQPLAECSPEQVDFFTHNGSPGVPPEDQPLWTTQGSCTSSNNQPW